MPIQEFDNDRPLAHQLDKIEQLQKQTKQGGTKTEVESLTNAVDQRLRAKAGNSDMHLNNIISANDKESDAMRRVAASESLDPEAKAIAMKAAQSGLGANQFESRPLERASDYYVFEEVPIPSGGVYYGPQSSLFNKTTIQIRHMCGEDEDVLTTASYIRSGRVIDVLIENCVMDKTLNIAELLIGDKDALMVALRITGLGGEYKVKVTCPSCSHRFENEFDLRMLQPRDISKLTHVPGFNDLFQFTFPVSQLTARFRLATAGDDKHIDEIIKANKALYKQTKDEAATTRVWYYTQQIGTVTDRNKLKLHVKTLPLKDIRAYREYMNSVQPGLNMEQFVTCPECGTESEVDIPMGIEFFWPELG
jgi:hypothetical protein